MIRKCKQNLFGAIHRGNLAPHRHSGVTFVGRTRNVVDSQNSTPGSALSNSFSLHIDVEKFLTPHLDASPHDHQMVKTTLTKL